MKIRLWFVVLLLFSSTVNAQQLIMGRVTLSFPEAMLALQDAIREHGYEVTRVQRVDMGLTASGYHTDKYRIVFFAKPDELRNIAEKFPQVQTFLPLKMIIFAEKDETLINTIDPTELQFISPSRELSHITMRWKNDINSIINDIRHSGE
ncbi:MAG: hypothetical protein ABW168_13825 [Sedimenticola sp.]